MVSSVGSLKRFIYLISPNKIYLNFYKDLEKVLSSKKVNFFQLRLKKTPKNLIIKIAKKIKKITRKYKVKLIINDDSKLAKEVNADGCHIGQFDNTVDLARKNIKKPIVVIGGITDKNYKELIKAGANYIAISTFIWNNPFLKPEAAIKKFK